MFFSTEFLNSLKLQEILAHNLILNIELLVKLLRNTAPTKSCNETSVGVKKLAQNVSEAKILTGETK